MKMVKQRRHLDPNHVVQKSVSSCEYIHKEKLHNNLKRFVPDVFYAWCNYLKVHTSLFQVLFMYGRNMVSVSMGPCKRSGPWCCGQSIFWMDNSFTNICLEVIPLLIQYSTMRVPEERIINLFLCISAYLYVLKILIYKTTKN